MTTAFQGGGITHTWLDVLNGRVFDQIRINGQYDVPVPAPVKMHVLANAILGGWQLGGIYTRQSGGPFTLRLVSDQAQTGSSQVNASNGAAHDDGA
jgi:hypothetical protein